MKLEELQDIVEELYRYLITNDKAEDASRIQDIKNSLKNGNVLDNKQSLRRLVAMCSVKYLGDVDIKEFDNPNDWWNFLSKVSALSNEVLNEY